MRVVCGRSLAMIYFNVLQLKKFLRAFLLSGNEYCRKETVRKDTGITQAINIIGKKDIRKFV